MAKESTTRIPRFDTGISRIPLPGSLRIVQPIQSSQTQLVSKIETQETVQVVKAIRPNSYSGLRAPSVSSTLTTLKKSLSGDRVCEAGNLMSRKATKVMKKFLTKPEKSEKNLEMMMSQSQQDNHCFKKTSNMVDNNIVTLEKGSKENSTEKLLIDIEPNETTKILNRTLTRSDTFVRDTNDDDTHFNILEKTHNMIHSTPTNLTTTIIVSKSTPATVLDETKILSTKIPLERTKIYQKHLIGVTAIPSPFINTKTNSNNKSSDMAQHQSLQQSQKKHANNRTIIKSQNNLTKTVNYNKTEMISSPELLSTSISSPFNNTLITKDKKVRKSELFGEISKVTNSSEIDLNATVDENDKTLTDHQDGDNLDITHNVASLPPDKNNMKLVLNSTITTNYGQQQQQIDDVDEKLIDITMNSSPSQCLMNITQDIIESPLNAIRSVKNGSKLLYMSPSTDLEQTILMPKNKNLCDSRQSLVARTPDDFLENMEIDDCGNIFEIPTNVQQALSLKALQELKQTNKPRFSFGLDLTECTLDCSIELCDISLASAGGSSHHNVGSQQSPTFKKQNSFELDESLGILTPDQMKEFLDSNASNTNNLELPLVSHHSAMLSGSGGAICGNSIGLGSKITMHQMRVDQTPSPEDLPLDTVDVKTDMDVLMSLPPHNNPQLHHQTIQDHEIQNEQQNSQQSVMTNTIYNELSQTDTEPKTDQMIKSNVSKVSTSFITSVTSITSLDTGYQGDGEMSRPASRSGVNCDQSPSNGPRVHKSHQIARQPSFNQQNIPIRRQDPMTDSDFFTESDADVDIFHRGDRRAQVIDGQLYGPSLMQQPAASVFISEQPEMEDSCMESSGIFTDVENRCDDDLAQNRPRDPHQSDSNAGEDIDMSPDGSTDTIKSKHESLAATGDHSLLASQGHQTNQLTKSQTSSTINSSLSSDRISISTDYNHPIQIKQMQSQQYQQQIHHIATESFKPDTTKTQFSITTSTVYQQQNKMKAINCGSNINSKNAFTGNITNAHSTSVKKINSTRKHAATSMTPNSTGSQKQVKKLIKNDLKSLQISRNSLNDSPSRLTKKPLRLSNDSKSMITKVSQKRNTITSKNQENQSPTSESNSNNSSSISISSVSGGGGSGGAAGNIKTSSPNCVITATRKITPNKWKAVMNKIAENKNQQKFVKKNYQQVKSKVSTGVVGSRKLLSPSASICNSGGKTCVNLIKNENGENLNKIINVERCDGNNFDTPTTTIIAGIHSVVDNNCPSSNSSSGSGSGCASGLASPQTKRLVQGAIKRGRSYSKDSQQSSQSDLSFTAGSPKVLAKSQTRSAKKRDVRNLSISPTDLGPPSKTQTTTSSPNGVTRTKNPTSQLSQKRISSSIQHSITTSQPILLTKGSPPPKKSLTARRPIEQKTHKTPLKDHNRLIGQQQQQQQNGTTKTNGVAANTGIGGGTLKGNNSAAVTSNLIIGVANKRNGTSAILNDGNTNLSKKHLQQQKNKHQQNEKNITRPTDPSEIRLQPVTQPEQKHYDKTIEALGILLQYLAHDLDAFACPTLKLEFDQAQKNLIETKVLLEDAKTNCHELQDKLQDKEHYYTTREQELQELHRCELNKVESSLIDFQENAKDRIASLEANISLKDIENQNKFQSYIQETELKFSQHEKDLKQSKDREAELLERLNSLTTSENDLRDKIQDAEDKFAERLQASCQREKDLTEKLNVLKKQFENIKQEADNKERELEEKLNNTQDEITVLKHSRNSLAAVSPKNDSINGGGATKVQMLENEVESLRCVLEIKQNEIADLRKKNHEITRENEELRAMQLKFTGTVSRMEDLEIQLKTKDEENRELITQIKTLKDTCSQEVTNRKRLTLHNEELQWKLKQNSEKYNATLTELSKSYQDKSNYFNSSKTSFHSQENPEANSRNSSLSSLHPANLSDRFPGCCFEMEDISPPSSPIIKGVVEKCDSVSWVLEMDDEAPEVLASRMVRRAGSFRSSFNEKFCLLNNSGLSHSAAKRQLSLPVNPLQQSASATVLSPRQQHSNEADDITLANTNSRIRSNSGSESKKMMRQSVGITNGSNSRKSDISASWKDPICSSSPYNRRSNVKTPSSPRSQQLLAKLTSVTVPTSTANGSTKMSKSFTASSDNEPHIFSNRKQIRHLITCDTSALTAGERLELRSSAMMPSHSSVQDLNALKKCQEIQESAGEAMVSGTNSEDESCSGSLDCVSSNSSASHSTNLSSFHEDDHKPHIIIEDSILMNKINSLNGTPMEVSWSSDADQFVPESLV